MGVAPSVAASTSMYMIMFTGAASTFLLIIFGSVNIEYVLFLAIGCGIGVIFTMYFVAQMVKKFKRQSIVSIIMAVILILSTAFSAVINTQSLVSLSKNGVDIM